MIGWLRHGLIGLRWRLLHTLWYVHPAAVFLVQTTPDTCLHLLARAAKPSTQRLELRNLFLSGRRYDLRQHRNGFEMRSTSKIPWRRKARTRVAAVVFGELSAIDDVTTRLSLRARMTPVFLLDVFLLPFWMGLLLLFGPLAPQIGLAALVLLLALSWLWHRYSAMLQAAEMVYFVQVVLEDLEIAGIREIAAHSDDVVYPDAFQAQWQKFYERYRDDQPNA